MKTIIRLLLRIPYFYYWSWKEYPYNFELWLMGNRMYWLARSPTPGSRARIAKIRLLIITVIHFIKKYTTFKNSKPLMKKIKFIDLFAGIGGIRLGFEQAFKEAGLQTECVMTSEIKPAAITTLTHNFPHDY